MSREYKRIQQYETKILALKDKGYTQRKIADALELEPSQVKNFFDRYNKKQQKLLSGADLRRRGRLPRDNSTMKQFNSARFHFSVRPAEDKRPLPLENRSMWDCFFTEEEFRRIYQ